MFDLLSKQLFVLKIGYAPIDVISDLEEILVGIGDKIRNEQRVGQVCVQLVESGSVKRGKFLR